MPSISRLALKAASAGFLFVLGLVLFLGGAYGGRPWPELLRTAALSASLAGLGAFLLVSRRVKNIPLLEQAVREFGAGRRDAVWPPGEDELGRLTGALVEMAEGVQRREELRDLLGPVPPAAAEELAARRELNLRGEKRTVTVLLCDIRRFTQFSQDFPPERVLGFLNDYFSVMAEVIGRRHGIVEQCIGDAMLAVFGAPAGLADHAAQAAACALELQARVAELNAERLREGAEPFQIGIAIHSGPVVAGPLGPGERPRYGVIGETVNMAARVEALNPKLGTEILATQTTYHLTLGQGYNYRSLGVTPVRGRIEPVLVYELLGWGLAPEDPETQTPRVAPSAAPEGETPIPRITMETSRLAPMLGRYEIERKLAEGAMGAVYLARDPRLRRRVAVKTMRFGEILPPQEAAALRLRFFREAEAAGRLQHPAIVQVYEAAEDQELPYIVMEYLEGDDLSVYCDKAHLLPPARVLEIGAKIAEALSYAHERGVIHRDVKPSNIMLLKDRNLRLTDFGIARIIGDPQTATGAVLGTPAYLSPEQVAGQKADGRSDLFSLGVVLFELLTGERPFKGGGEHMGALLFQIASEPHPDPRSINPALPKAFVDVVDRALQKNPQDRFASGREMAEVIRAGLGSPEPARIQ